MPYKEVAFFSRQLPGGGETEKMNSQCTTSLIFPRLKLPKSAKNLQQLFPFSFFSLPTWRKGEYNKTAPQQRSEKEEILFSFSFSFWQMRLFRISRRFANVLKRNRGGGRKRPEISLNFAKKKRILFLWLQITHDSHKMMLLTPPPPFRHFW